MIPTKMKQRNGSLHKFTVLNSVPVSRNKNHDISSNKVYILYHDTLRREVKMAGRHALNNTLPTSGIKHITHSCRLEMLKSKPTNIDSRHSFVIMDRFAKCCNYDP